MLSSKIDQQANANQTPKVIKETMDEDPDMWTLVQQEST